MNLSEEELKEVDFIKASSYRIKILKSLYDEEKTPTQIAKENNVPSNPISNVLPGLRRRGIVECINPDDVKWRYYKLTQKGKLIVDEINLTDID